MVQATQKRIPAKLATGSAKRKLCSSSQSRFAMSPVQSYDFMSLGFQEQRYVLSCQFTDITPDKRNNLNKRAYIFAALGPSREQSKESMEF
uniref:Uncharacterized protein n=1 Tax=Glossina morsitans morsitans TaxID=37546 RepID=A0A1B0G1F5_GLOMM